MSSLSKDINEEKVSAIIEKLHKILNKANLTIQEIILIYGNLGYHLGASMAGFQGVGPDVETLEKAYRLDPTIDVGLMLQGLLITSWEEDFIQKPQISNLVAQYEQQEAHRQQKEKENK